MAVEVIKADKVVRTALGLLERESVLPRLVWRDGVGDFAGAKDDTISVRLPAYGKAKTRALRSGAERVKSNLYQRKIDVTLTDDIYMDVPISDEVLELDITDFGIEILNPVVAGIVRGITDNLITTVQGATYANEFAADIDDLKGTFAYARELLNKSQVPQTDRVMLIGAEIDSAMIQVDNLVSADKSGSTDTLREAKIGRVYGFDVYPSTEIAPGEAFAFHKTAYALVGRAPKVPAGAPWGAVASFAGFAVRTVRVFDPDEVEDRFIADAWVGSNVVTDVGAFTASGMWVPAENPSEVGAASKLIRAVHITGPGESGESGV